MAPLVLAVHGGAGPRRRDDSDSEERARRGLLDALEAGRAELEAGHSALDAVTAAMAVLEDEPTFNAGRGSVLTVDGTVEMDACLMRGDDRAVGAVAAVRRVRHPSALARVVLEAGGEAILCGESAERLAAEHGLDLADEQDLIVERQRERWRRRAAAGSYGTVGAVALDEAGELAAATSTGGRAGQVSGRIGDSPLPGAGTWADSRTAAVSCTGDGEAIIRAACAHEVHTRIREGWSLAAAAEAAIRTELKSCGGTGGLIALGAEGALAMPFSTEAMARGWWLSGGDPGTAIG